MYVQPCGMITPMRTDKHQWTWILVILYILLIFRNSLTVGSDSESLSMHVSEYLLAILKNISLYTSDIKVFNHYVRKLAHFTEFAGLGFLTYFSVRFSPFLRNKVLNFLLILFTVPFLDETIQRFVPGRGPGFHDMMIDACGCLFGALPAYLLLLIIRDILQS